MIEQSPEDRGAVLDAAAELRSPEAEALSQLDGDWVVLWTDLGKNSLSTGLFTPTLKMLSFGGLPPVKVAIVDSYNRVKGDSYELLQVFQVPGSQFTAAMVLGGACTPDPEQPNRLSVQFNSVRVCPPLDASEGCLKMLEEAGLGYAIDIAVPIVTKTTYIDVGFIDSTLRVHKGQSGITYILKRLKGAAAIPFLLDV